MHRFDNGRVKNFKSPNDAAFWLWDYFYLHVIPTANEAKPWSRIECATIRIRDSVQYLDAQFPAPVRVRNAKRVRRAVREIVRLVDELESIPEEWVARALGTLEGLADATIASLEDEAKHRPLH